MRRNLVLLFALFVATSLFAQRPITFEDMAAMQRVGAPKLSPDGKWIAYDASTIDLAANVRRSAIYLVPADGSAAPRKISDGTKQDEGPVWSPDGKTIAYVSNREGGTRQLYLHDVASGAARKVTSIHSGLGTLKWTPDGKGLLAVSDVYPDCGVDAECTGKAVAAAEKAPTKARVIDSLLFRHWNTWQEATRAHVIHVSTSGALRDLTPGKLDAPPFSLGGGSEFDISPDGTELAYAQNTDERPERSTNSDIFLVPMSGGTPTRITTRTGADTAPHYSPDGRWIAWSAQSRAGYESDLWELWIYDRKTKTSKRIASEFGDWISEVLWSPDSKSLIVEAPLKGRTALYEVPLDGKVKHLYTGGGVSSLDISRDGKTIYFNQSTLRRPTEIFALMRGGNTRQITHANDELLSTIDMGSTEDMWWEGADGAKVQGHLIKPPNFDPSKKYPALVLIHGGPQGAWSDSWSYRWNPQPLAARGYVILMPNPRGSSGFGQKFVEEISGDWAGKVYVDLMNGVDQLVALPYVDGSRLGAAGGSYGGYMVNWILGHSNRFKALVSHAGVYNLESMYGVTEELWFPEWEFGGPFWEKPEQYEKWSPHLFVKNFNTPTLVTHGELDYRVPIGEGFQLFTALQRKGVPSRLLYFPDEGHWVLKPQNSKLWFQTVGEWFDRWLK